MHAYRVADDAQQCVAAVAVESCTGAEAERLIVVEGAAIREGFARVAGVEGEEVRYLAAGGGGDGEVLAGGEEEGCAGARNELSRAVFELANGFCHHGSVQCSVVWSDGKLSED